MCESLGNMIRIDYGSGHELAFVAFMYCLHKLSLVSDVRWLAGMLYPAYIGNLIRPIVLKRYRCEPAGSHGSWGLDDYYFVSYILGSSQLIQ
jgi:serine/threonine-protein phosphatase 2A activator